MWKLISIFFIALLAVSIRAADSQDDVADDDANECSKKKKCSDSNAVCRDGSCICKPLYAQGPDGKCQKAPTVGDKCALSDGTILDCVGDGVDAGCPADGPNKDKCQCSVGYEQTGKTCKFKDQNLHEKCDSDADCGVAFAACQSNKCECLSGFTEENKECKDYRCPSGQPLKTGNKVKTCEIQLKDNGNSSSDDCPSSTHFCFSTLLVRTQTGGYTGHCCTQVNGQVDKPVCPQGDAIPVDKCASDSDQDSSITNFDPDKAPTDSCPSLTHTCIDSAIGTTSLCCPVPCRGQMSLFAMGGRCYATVAPGQPCKQDVQCGRAATCQGDGGKKVCTCKSDFTLNDGVCERN